MHTTTVEGAPAVSGCGRAATPVRPTQRTAQPAEAAGVKHLRALHEPPLLIPSGGAPPRTLVLAALKDDRRQAGPPLPLTSTARVITADPCRRQADRSAPQPGAFSRLIVLHPALRRSARTRITAAVSVCRMYSYRALASC